MTDKPTEEGKRRFDPHGFYMANGEPGTPCRCTPECPSPCKGQCGCNACAESYGDFLSME